MDKTFLNTIKKELLERQEKIRNALRDIADRNVKILEEDYVTRFENIGDDEDENAFEVGSYEQNLALEQHLEKILRDINAALERITEGKYGICKYCGKKIDQRRLQARPVSNTCLSCKSKILKT